MVCCGAIVGVLSLDGEAVVGTAGAGAGAPVVPVLSTPALPGAGLESVTGAVVGGLSVAPGGTAPASEAFVVADSTRPVSGAPETTFGTVALGTAGGGVGFSVLAPAIVAAGVMAAGVVAAGLGAAVVAAAGVLAAGTMAAGPATAPGTVVVTDAAGGVGLAVVFSLWAWPVHIRPEGPHREEK